MKNSQKLVERAVWNYRKLKTVRQLFIQNSEKQPDKKGKAH